MLQRNNVSTALSSERYLSAGGLQDRTVDIAGGRRSQKRYRVGDLVGVRGPAQRSERAKTIGEPWRDGGSWGFGGPGLHRVHPPPGPAELVGPDTGEQFHARSRGTVYCAHAS